MDFDSKINVLGVGKVSGLDGQSYNIIQQQLILKIYNDKMYKKETRKREILKEYYRKKILKRVMKKDLLKIIFRDLLNNIEHLYGCLINPHQGLGPDLLKKLGQCSYIKLEPFGKYVQVLTNRFTDISFTFRNLRIDEDDVQHIDFVVSRQRSNDLLDVERVFGKSFTINELRFQDLLNTPRTLKEQTRASQCQKLTEEIFGP